MSGIVVATPGGLVPVRVPAKGSPFPTGPRQSLMPGAGIIELLTRQQRAATFEAMYRRQPWVYSVVNKLVKSTARLPLKTYEWLDDEQEGRRRTRKHPLARLLNRPYPRASGWTFKSLTAWNLCVHGNAVLLKVRPGPGAPPVQLWPLPWRHVEVIHEGRLEPLAYAYHWSDGSILYIDPADVVHVQWLGPDGMIGASPMAALASTLAIEDGATAYIRHLFENQARPSGAFTTKNKLDEKTFPRLRAELERLYAGVENAGRFGIFDQDLEFKSIETTAQDSGLVEIRKLSREEVCAAFDISPPMVGILERSTFNNIIELHKQLYGDSIGPILAVIEETLDAQLVEPDFGTGLFVEFDPGEFVRADVFARAEAAQKLLAAGWTINELRALDNKPPLSDPLADIPFVPLNLAPLGTDTTTLRIRIESAGILVRAGFDPADALEAVGLDPIAHLGLLPVTVQPPPEPEPGDTDPIIDGDG